MGTPRFYGQVGTAASGPPRVPAPDLSNLQPGATAVDLETGRRIHLEPGQVYKEETPEETAAREQIDEQT